MEDDISELIGRFVAEASAAARELAARHGLPIEYAHVQEALEDQLEPRRSEEFLHSQLDKEKILGLVGSYDFRRLFPEVLAMVTLDESIIPPGVLRRLDEKTIKSKGEVWRIHKNDSDPFPSNPHAINLESGLKLNLSTGDLYLKTTPVGQISKKDLIRIREKAQGIQLPPIIR